MNPINENNLTEQSLIDWLKGEGLHNLEYNFTYSNLGAKLGIQINYIITYATNI